MCSEGSSARQTKATTNKPVDATIMAVVDHVDLPAEPGGELDQGDGVVAGAVSGVGVGSGGTPMSGR